MIDLSWVAKELVRRWEASGVSKRPGVSDAAIAAFEQTHRVRLPREMADLFRLHDGMEKNEYDDAHVRMWPIAEVYAIESDPTLKASASPGLFVFADYMLWTHAYAVQLRSQDRNEVVLVGGKSPIPIADSFGGFLSLYLDDFRMPQ